MNARRFILNTITILFSGGIGFACGYYFTKNKFQTLADKEIESVKKVYEKHFLNNNEKKEEVPFDNKKPLVKQEGIYNKDKYVDYSQVYRGTEDVNKKDILKGKNIIAPVPYVIEDYQYGEDDDYEQQSLTYYSDGVLADDDEQIIKNVIDVIGLEGMNELKKLDAENSMLYIRDERYKKEYDICYSENTYSEIHNIDENM